MPAQAQRLDLSVELGTPLTAGAHLVVLLHRNLEISVDALVNVSKPPAADYIVLGKVICHTLQLRECVRVGLTVVWGCAPSVGG